MSKFKVYDIVEQSNLGDVPCMIVKVHGPSTIQRYDLEAIDGTGYGNIPEYLLQKARPASESKFGKGTETTLFDSHLDRLSLLRRNT